MNWMLLDWDRNQWVALVYMKMDLCGSLRWGISSLMMRLVSWKGILPCAFSNPVVFRSKERRWPLKGEAAKSRHLRYSVAVYSNNAILDVNMLHKTNLYSSLPANESSFASVFRVCSISAYNIGLHMWYSVYQGV